MQPTLILGDEPRVVIPVARSLWRKGVPVLAAGLHEEFRPVRSRAVLRSFPLAEGATSARQKLDRLCELVSRERVDFLIPSNDSALLFVADHYDELRALTTLACPGPAAVRAVLNKTQTMQAAVECGIGIPRSFQFAGLAELLAARDSLRFPLVAKPASKEVDARFKIRYYRNPDALETEYRADPDFGSKYLLQEYAPGEGVGIEVLMEGGQARLLFAHRRLKEHPSAGGVSVLAVAEPLIPELVESSVRLLNHIGWNGVAMVEFRYEKSTRTATLMEINGRFWGSLALAGACGFDFPYAAWQAAHGIAVQPVAEYPRGVRARWTAGVWLRLRDLFTAKDDGIPRPSPWREIPASFAAFLPGTRDMLWSWRDPRPAIQELASVVRRTLAEDAKRVIRRCVPTGWYRHLKTYRSLEAGARRIYLGRQLGRLPGRQKALPRGVNSVLFVCHGNIIRSPMAEALFRRHGAAAAQSAGTHARAGRQADERAIRVAAEFGVDLESHAAAPLTEETIERADLILAMDAVNEARLLQRFPAAREKLRLLGEFAPRPLPSDEIPDPYTGDERDIRECYRTIEECVARLGECLGGGR